MQHTLTWWHHFSLSISSVSHELIEEQQHSSSSSLVSFALEQQDNYGVLIKIIFITIIAIDCRVTCVHVQGINHHRPWSCWESNSVQICWCGGGCRRVSQSGRVGRRNIPAIYDKGSINNNFSMYQKVNSWCANWISIKVRLFALFFWRESNNNMQCHLADINYTLIN